MTYGTKEYYIIKGSKRKAFKLRPRGIDCMFSMSHKVIFYNLYTPGKISRALLQAFSKPSIISGGESP